MWFSVDLWTQGWLEKVSLSLFTSVGWSRKLQVVEQLEGLVGAQRVFALQPYNSEARARNLQKPQPGGCATNPHAPKI